MSAGAPQFKKSVLRSAAVVVADNNVGADAVPTGVADVIAYAPDAMSVTAVTRNQYNWPLVKPLTTNSVDDGSASDDATVGLLYAADVAYSIL